MEVSLPPEAGPVPVVLQYRLAPEPGTREVGLTLLSPRGVRLAGLQVTGPEGEIPFRLQELRPHYWTGSMSLPQGGEALRVRIGYSVEGGWSRDGRITLPIPAVAWVPSEPGPRTFVATVEVPEGVTVRESFPTSVTRKPRGSEGGVYEASLQAVPAMLVLRVARGPSPPLGLEGILDILVMALLLVMGAMGIRFLRGGAR